MSFAGCLEVFNIKEISAVPGAINSTCTSLNRRHSIPEFSNGKHNTLFKRSYISCPLPNDVSVVTQITLLPSILPFEMADWTSYLLRGPGWSTLEQIWLVTCNSKINHLSSNKSQLAVSRSRLKCLYNIKAAWFGGDPYAVHLLYAKGKAQYHHEILKRSTFCSNHLHVAPSTSSHNF